MAALYVLVVYSGLKQRVRDAALPSLVALLQVTISRDGSCNRWQCAKHSVASISLLASS